MTLILHVSQIAKEHIEKPSDVLKVGEEITAKVVDFKKDAEKDQPEYQGVRYSKSD